jgi:hypothetical protein
LPLMRMATRLKPTALHDVSNPEITKKGLLLSLEKRKPIFKGA